MYEKKFNDLKSERSKLIKKIKWLKDKLLDKSIVHASNIAFASKTIFVKPDIAEPQDACGGQR